MTGAPTNVARVLPVFSAAFAAIYIASVQFNWALFTYQAQSGQWGWLVQPREGTPMYWYGWLATSALGAGAIAALSLALPARPFDRVWSILVWVTPLVLIAVITYILRGYFLR